jgi:predicted PurR-regulated permease PerM
MPENSERAPNRPAQFSYWFILITFVLVAWLQLATPLLAILFAYLALSKFHFLKRWGKWLAVVLFFVVLAGIAYGLGFVVNQTVRDLLPDIEDKAIPAMIQWAKQHNIELPFTDFDSLKDLATETVKNQAHYLGSVARIARGAGTQLVFLIIGVVVAVSLFLNPQLEIDRETYSTPRNLYSLCCDEIATRFARFYGSFATVMGAQIVISAINTVFTTIFVTIVRLPHAPVVIGLTFLCGLLPVIGNLISNTLIVGISFTVSPRMALIALLFLVFIHKFEYFLNGKIIGNRIKNPLWLTLLALVIGERLMGVPGMILAPVVLHYAKTEASLVSLNR